MVYYHKSPLWQHSHKLSSANDTHWCVGAHTEANLVNFSQYSPCSQCIKYQHSVQTILYALCRTSGPVSAPFGKQTPRSSGRLHVKTSAILVLRYKLLYSYCHASCHKALYSLIVLWCSKVKCEIIRQPFPLCNQACLSMFHMTPGGHTESLMFKTASLYWCLIHCTKLSDNNSCRPRLNMRDIQWN